MRSLNLRVFRYCRCCGVLLFVLFVSSLSVPLTTFINIAPGKYWLITRVTPNGEPVNRLATPAAWDPSERAKLRREAMAAKNEIELQPCGRVKEYVLRFDH